MNTTSRTQTTDILTAAGLPKEIADKMLAAKAATSERCPLKSCRAGIGKFCIDIDGIPTYDGIHLARKMFTEADDLLRAAYGF